MTADIELAAGELALAGKFLDVGGKVEQFEKWALQQPQMQCPLRHLFAPGIYIREVTMGRGFVIGHCHKTEHFNIVVSGLVSTMIDGTVKRYGPGSVFKSAAAVRKVLFNHTPVVWQTIHATNNTDILELEHELIAKSKAYIEHCEIDVNFLQQHLVMEGVLK